MRHSAGELGNLVFGESDFPFGAVEQAAPPNREKDVFERGLGSSLSLPREVWIGETAS